MKSENAKPPRKPKPPPKSDRIPGYRKHITVDEVEKLIRAAGGAGRHRQRDALMVLMGFRHGFRVSELIRVRISEIDFRRSMIQIERKKHGSPSTHPLSRREVNLIRKVMKEYGITSGHLFMSERMDREDKGLCRSTVEKMIERAGERAGFDFPIHPHHLRHACGYDLANRGFDTRRIQDYLGHRNIQHTVEYTKLASNRFDGFFED